MQAREMMQDYQLAHWAEIIKQRTESGLTVKEFCKSQGFNKSKYFYWQRRLRDKACERLIKDPVMIPAAPQMFREVTVAQQIITTPSHINDGPGEVRVEVAGMKISADSSYPPLLIAALLKELVPSC